MGGDGTTFGNYSLIYRDAGTAVLDYGLVHFTDTGNQATFDGSGSRSGFTQSDEYRLGGAFMPWEGTTFDVGAALLVRSSTLDGSSSLEIGPRSAPSRPSSGSTCGCARVWMSRRGPAPPHGDGASGQARASPDVSKRFMRPRLYRDAAAQGPRTGGPGSPAWMLLGCRWAQRRATPRRRTGELTDMDGTGSAKSDERCSISRRSVLWTLAGAVTAGVACGRTAAAGGDTGPSLSRMAPRDLAARLAEVGAGRLDVLHVGPASLFGKARIPHSRHAGEASTPEGYAAVLAELRKLGVDREIILYCGCCPTRNCPNITPAERAAREVALRRASVLDLPTTLKADWTDQGFPVENG